jgi:hypothetical protein
VRLFHRTSFVIAAVAVTAAVGISVAAAVSGAATTADEQPSTVEDFGYPDAAAILAADHVQLISGDGHILYKICPPTEAPGLIIVRTSDAIGPGARGRICFQVTGPVGHLTLKVPNVFAVRGDGTSGGQGHKLKASLSTDAGMHTTVDVNPNADTEVGIAATPPGDPTTLLQLDAAS